MASCTAALSDAVGRHLALLCLLCLSACSSLLCTHCNALRTPPPNLFSFRFRSLLVLLSHACTDTVCRPMLTSSLPSSHSTPNCLLPTTTTRRPIRRAKGSVSVGAWGGLGVGLCPPCPLDSQSPTRLTTQAVLPWPHFTHRCTFTHSRLQQCHTKTHIQ
ncbi:hypothetical protein B0I35DRAFT_441958 [Stachybotrys elegans]|uniref:Secreted protein n=1 Tax=Stachybotrys elegans TaxID=80388 RepID=A0A8K0SIA6_9HYPO|nr:hypothetical protein B0I35DRAFT_441958 [Stachybotrys elegans]